MNALSIDTDGGRTAFRPGESLAGTASWALDAAPRRIELHLLWYTEGRPAQEVQVVQAVPFEEPLQAESRPFRLDLPAGPHSFQGALFSVRWALELVAEHPNASQRVELTLSPTGQPVQARTLPEEREAIRLDGLFNRLRGRAGS